MEEHFRMSMMPAWERFIKDLSEYYSENSSKDCDLWKMELRLLKAVMAFAVEVLVSLIELVHGRGYEGARRSCPGCGAVMRFERYQGRQMTSGFGAFSYVRAYYYCRGCHQGYCPLDERLGVGRRSVTPRLGRLISFLAGHLSFGVVEQALKESHQLKVSREAVRLIAEESGNNALEWERSEEERLRKNVMAEATAGGGQEGSRKGAKTWIIECDGKKVGYQDGSWHEVKVGVIYELGDRVKVSKGRQELIKREIVARQCGWEEFSQLFWTSMQRSGVSDGDRLVALADGAEAMEQIFAMVAPEATRVRDFYHVAERIHAIGEVRFGETGERQCWTRIQLHKLKRSEVGAVLRSIKHLKLPTAEAAETRRQVVQYLEKNRYAMNYASYKRKGWPLGSGAVEGGCRQIGARTNGCGRRWCEHGCNAIVALRVAVLNDRLELLLPKPKQLHQEAA
jgi:Uncharacterised protein family (UPF0236)